MSIEIISNVAGLLFGSAKAIDEGNRIQGIKIVAQAKALADFDRGYQTGRLRNSIMFKSVLGEDGFNTDSRGQAAAEENKISVPLKRKIAYLGTNVGYGVYVEFGTRKMAPQPFLRPAILVVVGKAPDKAMKLATVENSLGSLKKGQKRTTFF